jgi:hypothetical protein
VVRLFMGEDLAIDMPEVAAVGDGRTKVINEPVMVVLQWPVLGIALITQVSRSVSGIEWVEPPFAGDPSPAAKAKLPVPGPWL